MTGWSSSALGAPGVNEFATDKTPAWRSLKEKCYGLHFSYSS
jgi:hypothetical protein